MQEKNQDPLILIEEPTSLCSILPSPVGGGRGNGNYVVIPGQGRLEDLPESPSWHCHLTEMEGFGCPNDPRSYVVGGLFAPGRVTKGKLVQGEGPDKVQFLRPL